MFAGLKENRKEAQAANLGASRQVGTVGCIILHQKDGEPHKEWDKYGYITHG